MKSAILIFMLILAGTQMYAQTIVIDQRHLGIVNENGAVRSISEMGHHKTLNAIKQNTDDIGINTASLALVQTMIYKSLSEVNEALKDAIQVKNLTATIKQISQTSDEVLELASQDPILLLFAEEYIKQTKDRSLTLVAEVSTFVLAEGKNILINYNVRDELLDKVWQELQLINAYMLAVRNSMYWAKMSGVVKKLNPYQNFINKDRALINQIIRQKSILQP